MIGPHYEKLAEIEHRLTSKEMMTRLQSKIGNPLNQIVDKLKKEFSQYDTAYTDDIINHRITSVDRILSFDGKLGPILSGLQKENITLRKQLSILEGQLSNCVSICEQILAQNNELKNIVKKKNEDIGKIIETIANNESQARNELDDKISLLQQQNSILITHLEEIKKEHQQYIFRFEEKDDEIESWKKKWEECKKHLTETINHEHDLSRKLALTEQNLYQKSEELYDLKHLNQNLTFENNELKNQLLLLNEQRVDGPEEMKQKIQLEFDAILEENKVLKKERAQFLRQAEKNKLETEKATDAVNDLQRRVNKLSNDLELTTSLLTEEKKKNTVSTSNQSKMELKLNELKEENLKLKVEVQSSHNYAINREKILERQIEDLRRAMDDKNSETEKRMREIKDKTRSLIDAKQTQIKNLNDTNIELRRALQRNQH